MATQVTIRDETTAGQTTGEFVIDLLTERVTVRELIRSRVYQEVQDYNRHQPEVYRGLVQPTDAEACLNGCKVRTARLIDWHKQFDTALEAFEANQFLVLIDERQAEGLDEEFTVEPGTSVTFLRLVPLVGG
jgi:hypothetical protein